MGNGPFSSLTQKERFWGYMGITIIIAAVLVFAIIVWVIIQQRTQLSDKISKQHSSPPSTTWNGQNADTTNLLSPLPTPSDTNSN
jgi:hypothetical protein